MSQKVLITYVCDVCKDETREAARYTFGWANKSYLVELCDEHAEPYRQVAEQLLPVSMLVRALGVRPTRPKQRGSAPASAARPAARAERLGPKPVRVTVPPDPTTVRRWAQARGIDVPAKGKVPEAVVLQFREAGL